MHRIRIHIILVFILFCLGFSGYAQNFGIDFNSHLFNSDSPRPDNEYNDISRFYLKDSIHTYHYLIADSSWQLEQKSYFIYNDEGMEVHRLEIMRDSFNYEFTPIIRYFYEYNEDGLLNSQLLQTYNEGAFEWVDSSKYTFSGFTGHGKETLVIKEYWDTEKSEWQEIYKIEKVYDALNRLSSKIDKELVEGQWVLNQMMSFDYSSAGNLWKETSRHYNNELQYWENDVMVSYNYNTSNILLSSVNSVWSTDEGGSWDSLFVSQVEYNDQGNPVSVKQIGLDNQNAQGIELMSQLSEFDANGNLEEVSNEIWLEDKEEWLPADKSEYFYSSHIKTKLNLGEDQISCLFPNPQRSGAIWLCDGMRGNDQYVVRVIDLKGRVLYSSSIMPDQPFAIPVQLKRGLYLVNIAGSTLSHSEKVFFE